jgi:hypothetical protein
LPFPASPCLASPRLASHRLASPCPVPSRPVSSHVVSPRPVPSRRASLRLGAGRSSLASPRDCIFVRSRWRCIGYVLRTMSKPISAGTFFLSATIGAFFYSHFLSRVSVSPSLLYP